MLRCNSQRQQSFALSGKFYPMVKFRALVRRSVAPSGGWPFHESDMQSA
jgi:hypothetical protein